MDTGTTPNATRLVFAIAHEVGNCLGGIRLHAHLLDDELDARSLADASIAIDRLAGRSGPLLGLLRPLLSQGRAESSAGSPKSETWKALLGRLGEQIRDEGTAGVGFEIDLDGARAARSPGLDWIHPLLLALLQATLGEVARGDRVRLIGAQRVPEASGAGAFVVTVEDDGPEEDVTEEAAARGRPLAVSLARELLGRVGGQVRAERVEDGVTRVELRFPAPAGSEEESLPSS